MIFDVHTHHRAPQPEGIIALSWPATAEEQQTLRSTLLPDQLYSVGLHPWHTASLPPECAVSGFSEESLRRFEEVVALPNVVAVGECGLDRLQGATMAVQINALKHQVAVSEKVGKPLILHSVRTDDMILSLHRELQPTQPWVMHGYRGKPQGAASLTSRGIYVSLGERWNEATLRQMLDHAPRLLLAETDESPLDIHQIIDRMSDLVGHDITPLLAQNLRGIIMNYEL